MASNNDASYFRLLAVEPRVRELTGAVDLLTHYGLREPYETFCKKPLPPSLAETHYLQNVVGDTEIRRGEGMELGQLLQDPGRAGMPADHVSFHPLDFEMLRRAFTLRETGPILLPEAERGLPTFNSKVKDEQEDRDKKHKKKHKKHKHRDKDKEKDRDKEKEKKDRDNGKDKDKDRGAKGVNGEDRSRKHRKKKRKHEGEGEEADGNKHKSKKHKHPSKVEDPGLLMRNGK